MNNVKHPPMNTTQAEHVWRVLAEVKLERHRQHEKWGEQNHPDGTGFVGARQFADIARSAYDTAASEGKLTYRLIANEEICEAYAETDPEKLRAELVQAAAVFVAWIEAIDRRVAADSATEPV